MTAGPEGGLPGLSDLAGVRGGLWRFVVSLRHDLPQVFKVMIHESRMQGADRAKYRSARLLGYSLW
jgi:hypothetical protein